MLPDAIVTLIATLIGAVSSIGGGAWSSNRQHSRNVRYDLYLGDFRRLRARVDAFEMQVSSGARAFTKDLTNGLEEAARKARTGRRWDRELSRELEQLHDSLMGAEEELAARYAARGPADNPQSLNGGYFEEALMLVQRVRPVLQRLERELGEKV